MTTSNPCFADFLPQYDIVLHQFIDELGKSYCATFGQKCDAVRFLSVELRQESGVYGRKHRDIEGYSGKGYQAGLNSMFCGYILNNRKDWIAEGLRLGANGVYKFKQWKPFENGR